MTECNNQDSSFGTYICYKKTKQLVTVSWAPSQHLSTTDHNAQQPWQTTNMTTNDFTWQHSQHFLGPSRQCINCCHLGLIVTALHLIHLSSVCHLLLRSIVSLNSLPSLILCICYCTFGWSLLSWFNQLYTWIVYIFLLMFYCLTMIMDCVLD